MINIPSIHDLELEGERVLCRFDFNVPIKDGVIRDDSRLTAALPTIKYLIEKKARIIMLSHLGRPKGERVEELSLFPVAMKLGELLGKEVKFVDGTIGDVVKDAVGRLEEGELLLLENTRFHPEEEENDPDFAWELASIASVYVDDAFGTAHRKHVSTYGVVGFFEKKAAGLLMLREIENLEKLLLDPPSPFTLILGGAKLETKIPVIKNLAPLVDNLLIGGGMAFGFLAKKGIDVGESLVDESLFPDIENIFSVLKQNEVKLILPVDAVITKELKEGAENKIVDIDNIPLEWKGVDIGPKTIEEFNSIIKESNTIFWNGPLGVYEVSPFGKGTYEVATAIGEATKEGVLTVVGGGDTDKVIRDYSIDVVHLSTGGGASLRFLSGEELPAISVLK